MVFLLYINNQDRFIFMNGYLVMTILTASAFVLLYFSLRILEIDDIKQVKVLVLKLLSIH